MDNEEPTVRWTRRWKGVVVVGLLAGAVGLVAKRPLVLLAATVGVVYALYPRLTGPPSATVELDRTVSDPSPSPGSRVEVTVTVRNPTGAFLPDVRVVDGVPPMLRVTDGSARHATALGPGRSATFAYEVVAEHGRHRFEPATVLLRDVSGAWEVETAVPVETELRCAERLVTPPLRRETTERSGQVLTDDGGAGIEFHRTREYRPGDPSSHVDWKRFARTGELSTVDFREERAASVVVCLDARPAAYRAREGRPNGVAYGRVAVEAVLDALVSGRDNVGVAAIGREFAWFEPRSSGRDSRPHLATHPAFDVSPPEDVEANADAERAAGQVAELERRLDRGDQVVFVSPLTDEFVAEVALSLEAGGRPTTVVSPDVTGGGSPGERFASIEREARGRRLGAAGVPVVDWDPQETSLGAAILDAREGWAR